MVIDVLLFLEYLLVYCWISTLTRLAKELTGEGRRPPALSDSKPSISLNILYYWNSSVIDLTYLFCNIGDFNVLTQFQILSIGPLRLQSSVHLVLAEPVNHPLDDASHRLFLISYVYSETLLDDLVHLLFMDGGQCRVGVWVFFCYDGMNLGQLTFTRKRASNLHSEVHQIFF